MIFFISSKLIANKLSKQKNNELNTNINNFYRLLLCGVVYFLIYIFTFKFPVKQELNISLTLNELVYYIIVMYIKFFSSQAVMTGI